MAALSAVHDLHHPKSTIADRKLEVDVVIENLLDVSSSAQTFGVRFWLDLELDLTDDEVKKFKANPKESPLPLSEAVVFNNAVTIHSQKIYKRFDGSVGQLLGEKGNRFYQRTLIQGVFQEEMELLGFPFDVQELTIKFQMNPYDELNWTWSEVAPGKRFQVPSGEWLIPEATWDKPEDSWIGADVTDPKTATVKILVCRNWRYYINHYVSVLMMITGLLPAALQFESLSSMLDFISTMFLAGVAMLFVLEPTLPKQKDLTLLDKYVCWSFLFAFGTALVGFILEVRPDLQRDVWAWRFMMLTFALWTISHIFFAVSAVCTYHAEQNKLVFEKYAHSFPDPRKKLVIRSSDDSVLIPAHLEERVAAASERECLMACYR